MYFKFIFSVFILDEPAAFYAEEIFESFEEFGTNDERLQRIFVLRSEVRKQTSSSNQKFNCLKPIFFCI